jgi:hypothetical protein
MKKQLLIPVVLLLLLLSAAVTWAQSPVNATLTANSSEATVGDPIPLTLTVTHPAGYRIIVPELDGEWGDFVVADQSQPTTVDNEDGTQTTSMTIDGRLFAPGEYTTPSLTISVTDGAGNLSGVVVPPATVNIISVLVEGDTQLRDIKPQAELPYTPILPWVVGGLALAAVGLFAFVWMRRRARGRLAPVDNRLPHEVAMDELAHIESLNLPAEGRYKEHYTLISNCVRRYMEQTWAIPVLERTTAEIQASLRAADVPADVRRLFLSFLDESDLVKFSTFTPDALSASQLLGQARLIVAATRPLAAEETPARENEQPVMTRQQVTAATAVSLNGHSASSNDTLSGGPALSNGWPLAGD